MSTSCGAGGNGQNGTMVGEGTLWQGRWEKTRDAGRGSREVSGLLGAGLELGVTPAKRGGSSQGSVLISKGERFSKCGPWTTCGNHPGSLLEWQISRLDARATE